MPHLLLELRTEEIPALLELRSEEIPALPRDRSAAGARTRNWKTGMRAELN